MSKLAQQLTLTTALIVSGGAMAHEQNNDPHYDAHQSSDQNIKTMQGRLDKLEQLLEESKTLHKTDNLSAREKRMNLKQELKDDFKAEVKEARAELKGDLYIFSGFSLAILGGLFGILWDVARRNLERKSKERMAEFDTEITKVVADFQKEIGDRIAEVDEINEEQDEDINAIIADFKKKGNLSRVRTLTTVFTDLARSNFELFRNIPAIPKTEDFQQNSDLSYICSIAYRGYQHAYELQASFAERENDLDEKDCLKDDKLLVNDCLNNYIYYLSARGTPKDIRKVSAVMDDFESNLEKARNNNDKYWQADIATLIWARLHLGELTGEEAKEEIEKLSSEIKDKDWDNEIKKEMDFYNERFPKNEVKLSL